MSFLPVPKILKWPPNSPQQYKTNKSILLTSGCSFTSSTMQLEFAASWPGFVLDRCGFDHCIDYSYPGVGNEYIGDSILHHLASASDIKNYMVVVMWSGLNRTTIKTKDSKQPNLNGIFYENGGFDSDMGTRTSINKIFEVKEYLESNSIPYVFTTYCNLLFPPYVPKRDNTPEFDNEDIKKIDWVPTQPMDFLFEFAFKNSLLADDLFHPTMQGAERWTDEILLTSMCRKNLIQKY